MPPMTPPPDPDSRPSTTCSGPRPHPQPVRSRRRSCVPRRARQLVDAEGLAQSSRTAVHRQLLSSAARDRLSVVASGRARGVVAALGRQPCAGPHRRRTVSARHPAATDAAQHPGVRQQCAPATSIAADRRRATTSSAVDGSPAVGQRGLTLAHRLRRSAGDRRRQGTGRLLSSLPRSGRAARWRLVVPVGGGGLIAGCTVAPWRRARHAPAVDRAQSERHPSMLQAAGRQRGCDRPPAVATRGSRASWLRTACAAGRPSPAAIPARTALGDRSGGGAPEARIEDTPALLLQIERDVGRCARHAGLGALLAAVRRVPRLQRSHSRARRQRRQPAGVMAILRRPAGAPAAPACHRAAAP